MNNNRDSQLLNELRRYGIDPDRLLNKVMDLQDNLTAYKQTVAGSILRLIPDTATAFPSVNVFGEPIIAIGVDNPDLWVGILMNNGIYSAPDYDHGEIQIRLDDKDVVDVANMQRIRKLLYNLRTLNF